MWGGILETLSMLVSQKYSHNPNYLSATNLKTKRLVISSNINQIVSEADALIISIPSEFLSCELEKLN